MITADFVQGRERRLLLLLEELLADYDYEADAGAGRFDDEYTVCACGTCNICQVRQLLTEWRAAVVDAPPVEVYTPTQFELEFERDAQAAMAEVRSSDPAELLKKHQLELLACVEPSIVRELRRKLLRQAVDAVDADFTRGMEAAAGIPESATPPKGGA